MSVEQVPVCLSHARIAPEFGRLAAEIKKWLGSRCQQTRGFSRAVTLATSYPLGFAGLLGVPDLLTFRAAVSSLILVDALGG